MTAKGYDKQNMSLPEWQCPWCGEWFKWVRVLRRDWNDQIDIEPISACDPRATYVRVNPKVVGGLIDVARPIRKAERAELCHRLGYTRHRDTCRERQQWTGHKKWNATPTIREEWDSPERDVVRTPNSGRFA
jgi:hypothetical protein